MSADSASWVELSTGLLNLAAVVSVSLSDDPTPGQVFVHLGVAHPDGPTRENLHSGMITWRYAGQDAQRILAAYRGAFVGQEATTAEAMVQALARKAMDPLVSRTERVVQSLERQVRRFHRRFRKINDALEAALERGFDGDPDEDEEY